MVNYCCVKGCHRNSRASKHLNYFILPKDKHRQKKWLKLAGREELLEEDMERLRKSLRFCSRHFHPNCMKNRILSNDALPSKSLPGSENGDEADTEPEKHEGIVCDSCSEAICGFRYKCVTCDNYDLCQKCEMLGSHPQHYMLRIPKSIKFQLADDLLNKWQEFFKAEHIIPGSNPDDLSSDDEPVTKYIRIRKYDSGIELSENIKRDIRNEVDRALKCVEEKKIKQVNQEIPSKKIKLDTKSDKIDKVSTVVVKESTQCTPEVVFADVNEYVQNDIKNEASSAVLPEYVQNDIKNEASSAVLPLQHDQMEPVYYVKLSGDLSELMIELTQTKE